MEKIINLTETESIQEVDASNFLDLKILKEGAVSSQTKTLKRDMSNVSISCIVLLEDSKQMQAKEKSYNLEILGNPMFQYVVRACPSVPLCVEFDHDTGDVFDVVKKYMKNTEYTLVLYSDTPLITKSNILNIIDFVVAKGLNVCKLTRGWVFKNDYVRRVDQVYAPSTYYFEEEDFMMAVTYKQLYIITETLKNRIISYHMQNGVYFKSPDTTYIESNVAIDSGVTIDAFTSLSGNTEIGKNVHIGARSTLKNAKVFDGALVDGALIDGGIVCENAIIKTNAKIFEQTAIKANAIVGQDTIISNAIIGEGSTVGKNCVINYLVADQNVAIGNSCVISGKLDNQVTINKNANISDLVTIMPGAKILEGINVKIGKKIKQNKVVDDND